MTVIYIKDFYFFIFNVFKFGLHKNTDAPVGQEKKKKLITFSRMKDSSDGTGSSGFIL